MIFLGARTHYLQAIVATADAGGGYVADTAVPGGYATTEHRPVDSAVPHCLRCRIRSAPRARPRIRIARHAPDAQLAACSRLQQHASEGVLAPELSFEIDCEREEALAAAAAADPTQSTSATAAATLRSPSASPPQSPPSRVGVRDRFAFRGSGWALQGGVGSGGEDREERERRSADNNNDDCCLAGIHLCRSIARWLSLANRMNCNE